MDEEVRIILIIDDSRVSRMMVKAIAKQKYSNAIIYETANADETFSLEIAEELTHIICDYNMPGMDGLSLCEKLQKKHPKAYICLLTANIQVAIRNKAEKIGIHFVKKPVTEERINNILSKTGGQDG